MELIRIFPIMRLFGIRIRHIALLLGLQFATSAFEGVGVAMVLPVIQLLQPGNTVESLAASSRLWQRLLSVHQAVGLSVSVGELMIVVFIAILVRQAFSYVFRVYTAHLDHGARQTARDEFFRRLLAARLSYVEEDSQGVLINDMTVGLHRAMSCISAVLRLTASTILLLVYLALMLALSATLTGLSIAIIILSVASLRGVMRRTKRVSELCIEIDRRMSAFIVERLRSIRLIRLAVTETPEVAAMMQINNEVSHRHFVYEELLARQSTLLEPVATGLLLGFLYFGINTLKMSIEELGLFLLIVMRLLPVVTVAAATRQIVIANRIGLDAIADRLRQMSDAQELRTGQLKFKPLRDGIRFEGVSFHYRDREAVPALENVSITIPACRFTALVGPSGSGKSTFIDLLPRIRLPQSGAIYFDGVDGGEFATDSLRAAIAYAPQSPQIFNVTPAQHIRYGWTDATDADVLAAARLAGAHDFIEALPQGYDTPLGENGVFLSGGQRQRLDLARALVRPASILVLDEPTSTLDADAEHAFREALQRIRSETDTTIIVIGHRLSTILNADQIVVLHGGRVIETGTHHELMARSGWYSSAYQKQHGPGLVDAAVARAG